MNDRRMNDSGTSLRTWRGKTKALIDATKPCGISCSGVLHRLLRACACACALYLPSVDLYNFSSSTLRQYIKEHACPSRACCRELSTPSPQLTKMDLDLLVTTRKFNRFPGLDLEVTNFSLGYACLRYPKLVSS